MSRRLTGTTQSISPETKAFDPWDFNGGYLSGRTQLIIQSDGTAVFRGHVHDSGAVAT